MRGESVAERVATAAVAVATAFLTSAAAAGAQDLADYDYENLRLRGVGVEFIYVSPNDLEATVGIGARIDLGFLGPHIRVVPRFAYWNADVEQGELDRLGSRLADLIQEQNPDQPRPQVDLGSVERDAIIFGSDLHWMPFLRRPVRPYLGVGSELYILDGEGEAIEDTFVEDALDLFTAGVSGVVGLEVDVRRHLTLYGELRGALVADVRNVSISAGVAYLVP